MRTVALFGASGLLGRYISSAFLSGPFRQSFSKVIVLLRQMPHDEATISAIRGAEIRIIDESTLEETLKDVEVVINAIGPTGHEFKDSLLNVIAKLPGVRLYVPSEFGVDHTIHEFTHPEWDHKKQHFQLAQKLLSSVQICRIFIGLFTEESIGPWFGFRTTDGIYECIGSSNAKASFTSLGDTGLVVASIARTPYEDIPKELHIGGSTVSVRDIAGIMEQCGSGNIAIEEIALPEYKARTLKDGTKDPSRYLRFLFAEERIRHDRDGLGNDNELVNPQESLWKWKTMRAYGEETHGKPWSKHEWDPKSIV